MDDDEARTRLLDAAATLFYQRGVHAVGMDDIRAASGVSLKRLYRCFPAKDDLVRAWLRRRDHDWLADLAACVERRPPQQRPLAVFDWLGHWFAGPGFRGCAFVNAYGELGATSGDVAQAARDHKLALRAYVTTLARDARVPDPAQAAAQLVLLIEGAIVTAALTGDPATAAHARAAAATLLAAAPPAPSAPRVAPRTAPRAAGGSVPALPPAPGGGR